MQPLSRQELHRRCNQILDCIPADYAKRDSIFRRLGDRWESAVYTAPDNVTDRFRELGIILSQELPEPTPDGWTQHIAEIMTRKRDPDPVTDWMSLWFKKYRNA